MASPTTPYSMASFYRQWPLYTWKGPFPYLGKSRKPCDGTTDGQYHSPQACAVDHSGPSGAKFIESSSFWGLDLQSMGKSWVLFNALNSVI